MFLKYVAAGGSYQYDLLEGAKSIQLAELGLESWKQTEGGSIYSVW